MDLAAHLKSNLVVHGALYFEVSFGIIIGQEV